MTENPDQPILFKTVNEVQGYEDKKLIKVWEQHGSLLQGFPMSCQGDYCYDETP